MAWQKKAQFVTVSQAMQKLEKYCAYQERSQKQVQEKCRSLGLTEAETGEVMVHLLQNDFLNESRFAFAYARGKSKIKNWGSEKIRQGLKLAGVSDSLVNQALGQLTEVETDNHLEKWAQKKLRNLGYSISEVEQVISGNKDIPFEHKQKIKQFLFGKGFRVEEQLLTLGFLKN